MSRISTNQISVNNIQGKNSITIGDFNFGVTGGDDYGLTYQTNFYNGVPVPVGGFVIYENNAGTITAHAPKDDNECLYYLNKYGANATNISDALNWASFQSYLMVRSFEFPIEDLPGYGGLTGYWNIVTGSAGYAPAWYDGTIMFPDTQVDGGGNIGLSDLSQVITQGSIYINILDSAGNDQSTLLGSAYGNAGTITFTQGNSNITFGFQNDTFQEGYFGAGVLYWDPGMSPSPTDLTIVSSNHPIFTDGLVQITITI
jgi:hypothetical protein